MFISVCTVTKVFTLDMLMWNIKVIYYFTSAGQKDEIGSTSTELETVQQHQSQTSSDVPVLVYTAYSIMEISPNILMHVHDLVHQIPQQNRRPSPSIYEANLYNLRTKPSPIDISIP
jgi:hypothetical protein